MNHESLQFPELLGAAAVFGRLGIPADDIGFGVVVRPSALWTVCCITSTADQRENRVPVRQYVVICESVPKVLDETPEAYLARATALVQEDTTRWNKLPQAERDAVFQNCRARKDAVRHIVELTLRDLYKPSGVDPLE